MHDMNTAAVRRVLVRSNQERAHLSPRLSDSSSPAGRIIIARPVLLAAPPAGASASPSIDHRLLPLGPRGSASAPPGGDHGATTVPPNPEPSRPDRPAPPPTRRLARRASPTHPPRRKIEGSGFFFHLTAAVNIVLTVVRSLMAGVNSRCCSGVSSQAPLI
jgi:hypothetical protein